MRKLYPEDKIFIGTMAAYAIVGFAFIALIVCLFTGVIS